MIQTFTRMHRIDEQNINALHTAVDLNVKCTYFIENLARNICFSAFCVYYSPISSKKGSECLIPFDQDFHREKPAAVNEMLALRLREGSPCAPPCCVSFP